MYPFIALTRNQQWIKSLDSESRDTKPVIAYTAPDKGGITSNLMTSLSIKMAGGVPLKIQPKAYHRNFKFDGLIFTGGKNLSEHNVKNSVSYNIERSLALKILDYLMYPFRLLFDSTNEDSDSRRDRMEFDLFEIAEEKKIPILGICRGHQLINVKTGGTLITNTDDYYPAKPRVISPFGRKKVILEKSKSLLNKIYGKKSLSVNALHEQAVVVPGEGFKTVAREENGMIQACARTEDEHKILGVQWHPEYMPYDSDQHKLFYWIVNEAKKLKEKKYA